MYNREGKFVFRFALLLFALHPLQGQYSWLRYADDGARVVVDTNVTCDGRPDFRFTISVGMPIRVAQEIKVEGNTWYLGYPAMAPNSPCWVYGPSTAVWRKADTDSLLLSVFDHVLARRNVTFEEFVEIENFLLDSDSKWRSEAGRKQVSGLLQFRWLQLLSRVLRMEGFYSRTKQPLVESWILNHGELFEYGPSAEWYVPTRYFWQVYESNKTAPWAEELVWFVASLPVQHDECNNACVLGAYIGDRFLQYWTRFPTGPHIADALAQAGKDVRSVAGGDCESEDDLKLVADIRASLSKVTDPAKREILNSLGEIERKCAK
jgi:hypothetical protein